MYLKQIKVKELPIDWLVTDTYYPSGNKEFVSEGMHCKSCDNTRPTMNGAVFEYDPYTGVEKDPQTYMYCYECKRNPKMINKRKMFFEKFGTKHIQLIGANGKAKTWILQDGEEWYMYLYSNNIKVSQETYEEIKKYEQSGKDFFIYRVGEVKDEN